MSCTAELFVRARVVVVYDNPDVMDPELGIEKDTPLANKPWKDDGK